MDIEEKLKRKCEEQQDLLISIDYVLKDELKEISEVWKHYHDRIQKLINGKDNA